MEREDTGRRSVYPLPHAWFIACSSRDLRRRPVARTIQGSPIVLFRDAGGLPRALLDRCAHRNVPLTLGRVTDRGEIRCAYHGWRFDGTGACTAVPGRLAAGEVADAPPRAARVPAFATREQDGFVWVLSTPDEEPPGPPPRFPYGDDRRYGSIRRTFRVEASMHAAIENALDVPHTAFLHRGLHRGGKETHDVDVVVRRVADRAEAEFSGEPRPAGLAGKILAPGGGVVEHVDRFVMPCIAQVEYRIGDDAHVVLTAAHTPVTDDVTDVHAVGVFRLRVPRWLVRVLALPIAKRILRQDQEILCAQADAVRRFGGEDYASTELDVLGHHVAHLLERAARGEAPDDRVVEHRLRMRV